MYILVDCNNFFASCEIIANPQLRGKPLVVLSNIGGIVLARSNEAKALGIPMGACAFRYETLFKKAAVHVALVNFSLYSSCSKQVMQVLESFGFDMQVYSIDEAFLWYEKADLALATEIKQAVFAATKVPVSVGIGKTKTQAKAAVHFAKKGSGAFVLEEKHLQEFPIEEIWGVGARTAEKLHSMQVYTAQDFIALPDYLIKQELSVFGLRMALELRGIACSRIDDVGSMPQSISTARALKKVVYTYEELEKVALEYVKRVVQELRENEQRAKKLTLFIATSPFGTGEKYYNEKSYTFPEAASSTPPFLFRVQELLRAIFQEGYAYKKLGVILSDLVSEEEVQYDLFAPREESGGRKDARLMNVVDELNAKYGRNVITFGK